MVQDSHMAHTPNIEIEISLVTAEETQNRARKAALLAKTAVDAGVTVDLLAGDAMRRMVLAATYRPGHHRMAQRTWTAASDRTWAQVVEIVRVFGA